MDLQHATDAELVERIRRGPDVESSEAASELLGRYRERVYRWCRRYVRQHEDALDLAQDVLLIAFRSLHTYEGRSPFGGWLFTITHHRCLRAVRQAPPAHDEDCELEELPDLRSAPGSEIEAQQDLDDLLFRLNEHLDPDERKAVWLRCVEEMPIPEVTRVLGLTNATGARGLLQTARRKLRAARRRAANEDGGSGR